MNYKYIFYFETALPCYRTYYQRVPAEYYGFEGEIWTRARVGEVIKQHFGVSYEVSTIGLLLKELGFTLQKPTRRDYRQNPQCVAQWQEEILPELKKTAAQENRVIF